MEHKHTIEQYKKALQTRIIACGGTLMFLGGILIIGGNLRIKPAHLSESAADFYLGLLTGCVIGCIFVAAFFIAKMLLDLRNEETLRAAYVKETDERNCAVWQKAGYLGWRVSNIILVLAALTAGYFSLPVAISLLAAAAFTCLCVKIAYLFYDKTL